ncbi:hypothetical protein [Staphylococcus felis]|uniref:hypothetical protein n=1 Tax=Staphylococcus felis TaxID=46127 RepID=UPI0015F24CDB|nr:hypothetical protein [Staphylococcus felis]
MKNANLEINMKLNEREAMMLSENNVGDIITMFRCKDGGTLILKNEDNFEIKHHKDK